jgi:hypothetical protein
METATPSQTKARTQTGPVSQLDAQAVLKNLEAALNSAPRRRLCCDAEWAKDITAGAGVYAIWDAHTGEPVYVGETSGLLARMGDQGRTVNHTFRRILIKRLGLARTTDAKLNAVLAQRFELAFLPVSLGRSELEEYLVLRWRRTLYNKPALRLRTSTQYEWVKQAV